MRVCAVEALFVGRRYSMRAGLARFGEGLMGKLCLSSGVWLAHAALPKKGKGAAGSQPARVLPPLLYLYEAQQRL